MRRLALILLVSCTIGGVPTDQDDDGDDGDGAGDVSPLVVPGVDVTRDVIYDGVHALDIYSPTTGTPHARPLVMWIHGGGFAKNSRSDPHIIRLAQHSATLGYVSVSIDYTLANPHLDPSHPYPYPWDAVTAARADAAAALRFLRAHATEYNIDPQRVAVGGASAGSMTALELAYGSTPADRDDGILAVVDLWGAMETRTLLQPGDAPLLILHGTADDLWMPYEHALALRDSAHEVGVPCEFFPLAGKNHGPWEGLDSYLADMTPFLRRYLGN
jgi:para-nitrobenzyl esterase